MGAEHAVGFRMADYLDQAVCIIVGLCPGVGGQREFSHSERDFLFLWKKRVLELLHCFEALQDTRKSFPTFSKQFQKTKSQMIRFRILMFVLGKNIFFGI